MIGGCLWVLEAAISKLAGCGGIPYSPRARRPGLCRHDEEKKDEKEEEKEEEEEDGEDEDRDEGGARE